MKTATLDVGGMLSLLDYQAVKKQLGWIPGVQRATASVASNSVTVEYDETVTSVAALKAKIRLPLHRPDHAQACLRTTSR